MARGIYKRGNTYWIRYAGLDGRVVYESSNSDKFKDAEALFMQRKQAIREGKQPEIKRIKNHTFTELAGNYLTWIEGRQKSTEVKTSIIKQLINVFGNLPLGKFNTAIVEQLQTDLINRELKNSYCNKILAVLKHMFTKASEWEMITAETLKRTRKVKMLQDNSRRLRYLSKDECHALVNSCDSHLKPIVITALNTGMRRGEILNLKWEQVDLKHGFILLSVTKNGERREIPINKTLEAVFLSKSLIRRLDIPYVFYEPATGKPYKDVRDSLNIVLRKAKIRDFTFHDLRHTFASQLVMAGVDITTVKELLGHKTLTMTLRYAHLAPSHIRLRPWTY